MAGLTRPGQAAILPISAPQCLHFVAAGFRSSERHAGQVLVGGGSANTVLPIRAMTYLYGTTIRKYTTAIDDGGNESAQVEISAIATAADQLPA